MHHKPIKNRGVDFREVRAAGPGSVVKRPWGAVSGVNRDGNAADDVVVRCLPSREPLRAVSGTLNRDSHDMYVFAPYQAQ